MSQSQQFEKELVAKTSGKKVGENKVLAEKNEWTDVSGPPVLPFPQEKEAELLPFGELTDATRRVSKRKMRPEASTAAPGRPSVCHGRLPDTPLGRLLQTESSSAQGPRGVHGPGSLGYTAG